jgi:hypothetical protein
MGRLRREAERLPARGRYPEAGLGPPTQLDPGRRRGSTLSGARGPGSGAGYFAGRKATWIWMATPGGADIRRISLVR